MDMDERIEQLAEEYRRAKLAGNSIAFLRYRYDRLVAARRELVNYTFAMPYDFKD